MIKKKFSQINYGQKSKSLKTNSMISIFLKNKKPSTSILMNSKNSESTKLSPNRTDYKYSQTFIGTNSLSNLNQSKTSFYLNKLSNQILPKKKQSYNIFKSNPLSNELRKENYLLNSKNDDIYINSSNYNDMNQETEIYQKSNTIFPSIRIKKGEFEISEEDKMFDQFLLKKKNKKIKKEKAKIKLKTKPKKKKLNFYNSNELPLNKVYKRIPLILNKIESTKKLKNSFSLLKYQNLLLDIGSKNLDWDSRVKLTNEFHNLRNITNKKYELLRNSVKDIENQEKEIIDDVNRQQEYYKKNMREKNYYCMTIGMNFYSIPNLKFHRTLTKLKFKKKS